MLLKILLAVAGTIFVILGLLGVFLPLLPTTPFLLLAAACYVRSSQRLYDKLLNSPLLGKYIRNYREHRAIPMRAKIVTVALLWVSITFACVKVIPLLIGKLTLIGIALAVSVFVMRIKTLEQA